MASEPRLHLLSLPPEIRENVYRLILNPDANRLFEPDEYTDYDYRKALVLFKINKKIYAEARKVFRDLNVFVRIETPWPQAQEHVAFQGHMPILMRQERAAKFNGHSLNVAIDAPHIYMQNADSSRFVIHLDDLDKFTKTWVSLLRGRNIPTKDSTWCMHEIYADRSTHRFVQYYADLSNPGLNQHHLRLALHLRDPYTPDWDDKRMPRWLQRKLLLPFGAVKGLRDVAITGDPKPYSSIEAELLAEQAVPYPTAEHCLREATRLKLEGNSALKIENYNHALEKYAEAWEAMHIVVKGRQRHIHADEFFGKTLLEDPFKGKNGQSERLMIRVQLVANTVLVYLKLEDWEEATFWGMRTIRMLREAMGADANVDMSAEDEAVLGFPAADQMGKIYYRTALAYKEMDDKPQARKLLRVSHIYLPNDQRVQQEIADCALRLG